VLVDATGLEGSGRWRRAGGARNHYGPRSFYAAVGGGVDSYTLMTPPLTQTGQYRVSVWNSCYSPRATNVPHTVGSRLNNTNTDIDTQPLNQDCRTGLSGQWQDLGLYTFTTGTQAYLTISDTNLTTGRYIGVDAARFTLQTPDTDPPVVEPPDTAVIDPPVDPPVVDPPVVDPPVVVVDDFAGTGPLLGYTTTRADALPGVGRVDGRYHAPLLDNSRNQTLHYNRFQGRLDAKPLEFPFEYIARNIGIGTLQDSQSAPEPTGRWVIFAGVQVHATDLDAAESAHVVVGHRGNTHFTIEGKNTVAGRSIVNDLGAGSAPLGRADIKIVGNSDRTLTVYWQEPNLGPSANDDWQLYRSSGQLPGRAPAFGPSVYVGLITYASGSRGVPFVGTADSVEFIRR